MNEEIWRGWEVFRIVGKAFRRRELGESIEETDLFVKEVR